MTNAHRRFADEYAIDCNAGRAYKAAYPRISDKAASAGGYRLLKRPDVKAYLTDKLEKISSEKTAEAKEVMEYLTSVMRGESSASVVVVEGCGDGISEARIVKKAPDEKERLKAAELIGKRYRLFTDKVDFGGPAKVVIVDDIE